MHRSILLEIFFKWYINLLIFKINQQIEKLNPLLGYEDKTDVYIHSNGQGSELFLSGDIYEVMAWDDPAMLFIVTGIWNRNKQKWIQE